MRTPLTIAEKIVASLMSLIGFCLAIDASIVIYRYHFTDILKLASYMVSMTTLVSNSANGILLGISSIIFFKNKQKGAKAFQFSGVMFLLYIVNLVVLDFIESGEVEMDFFSFYFPSLLLLGAFLYFWNKRFDEDLQRNWLFEFKSIFIAILTYLLIDVVFYDWHPLDIREKYIVNLFE